MKVTKEMVAKFIGSDHLNVDELLEEIVDLINGEYPIEEAQQDILDYDQM